mmetsp:Transcript_13782/g.34641  ORF Transcript_13782/g.34641 Transcript_13782/m.34641 type:complete len:264 (-) Transcript_13782:44-835(-)
MKSAVASGRLARAGAVRGALVSRRVRARRVQLAARRAALGERAEEGEGREEGEGERFLDVDSLLQQGKEESRNFVFSAAEEEDDDGDWMDRHFESLKPMEEGEEARRREEGEGALDASSPALHRERAEEDAREQEGEMPNAYAIMQELGARDAHDLLSKGSMTIIDVRSREEYKKCRVKTFPWQSVNIPFTEFPIWNQTGGLSKYRPFRLGVICNSGQTSKQAVVRLTRVYGFDPAAVSNIRGGINEWILAGYPTEQGDAITE